MQLTQLKRRHLRAKHLQALLASVTNNRLFSLLRITRRDGPPRRASISFLISRLVAISRSHRHMRYLLIARLDV